MDAASPRGAVRDGCRWLWDGAMAGRPKLEPLVVVAALSVILTAVVMLVVFRGSPSSGIAPIEIIPPPPTPTRDPTATPGPLAVYVTGAVMRPGVVMVAPGSRVEEAIDAAGGPAQEADLRLINLAAPLADGQQVWVPVAGQELAPVRSERLLVDPALININTATADELTALPGIGETLAARIVSYREQHGPFTQIDEIMNVSGIGEGKFNDFREMITVGP